MGNENYQSGFLTSSLGAENKIPGQGFLKLLPRKIWSQYCRRGNIYLLWRHWF